MGGVHVMLAGKLRGNPLASPLVAKEAVDQVMMMMMIMSNHGNNPANDVLI